MTVIAFPDRERIRKMSADLREIYAAKTRAIEFRNHTLIARLDRLYAATLSDLESAGVSVEQAMRDNG